MENHWPQKRSQGKWRVMLSVEFSMGLIAVGEVKDWFMEQWSYDWEIKSGEIPKEYSKRGAEPLHRSVSAFFLLHSFCIIFKRDRKRAWLPWNCFLLFAYSLSTGCKNRMAPWRGEKKRRKNPSNLHYHYLKSNNLQYPDYKRAVGT